MAEKPPVESSQESKKERSPSTRRSRAAELVARGWTPEEASLQAGISLQTLREWEAFDAEYQRLKARFEEELNERAFALARGALIELTQHEDPSVSARAASALLDYRARTSVRRLRVFSEESFTVHLPDIEGDES